MLASFAAIANTGVLCVEAGLLSGVATTVQAADELVPWLPAVIVAFVVFQVAAVSISVLADKGALLGSARSGNAQGGGRRGDACADARQIVLLAVSAACSLAGCFAVRFAFYAMHMTSGM